MKEIIVKDPFELADFIDAMAMADEEFEDFNFIIKCPIDKIPEIRNSLGEDLKYFEPDIKPNYVGTVLYTPIYFDKDIDKVQVIQNGEDA